MWKSIKRGRWPLIVFCCLMVVITSLASRKAVSAASASESVPLTAQTEPKGATPSSGSPNAIKLSPIGLLSKAISFAIVTARDQRILTRFRTKMASVSAITPSIDLVSNMPYTHRAEKSERATLTATVNDVRVRQVVLYGVDADEKNYWIAGMRRLPGLSSYEVERTISLTNPGVLRFRAIASLLGSKETVSSDIATIEIAEVTEQTADRKLWAFNGDGTNVLGWEPATRVSLERIYRSKSRGGPWELCQERAALSREYSAVPARLEDGSANSFNTMYYKVESFDTDKRLLKVYGPLMLPRAINADKAGAAILVLDPAGPGTRYTLSHK